MTRVQYDIFINEVADNKIQKLACTLGEDTIAGNTNIHKNDYSLL